MRITKQNDIKDCGLHVLQYFIKLNHSKDIGIDILKNEVSYGKNGISLLSLKNLAEIFGVSLRSFEVKFNDLLESNIKGEFIALLNSSQAGHYVIVEMGKKIKIKDSIKGEYFLSIEEFKESFTGVVVFQEKTIFKYQEIKFMKYKISADYFYVAFGLLTTILSVVLSLSSTIFMKIVFDKILPYHLESTLNLLSIAFCGIVVFRIVNGLIKKYSMRFLYLKIENDYKDMFLNKISEASLKSLNKFKREDILRRFSYIGSVTIFTSTAFFTIFSEAIYLIISTSLLIWVSPELFGITIGFAAIIVMNSVFVSLYNNGEASDLMQKQMEMSASSFFITNNLEMLKSPLSKEFMIKKFERDFQVQRSFERRSFNVNSFSKTISEFLNLIFPIVLTYFSSKMIFDSKLSVGELMMMTTTTSYLFSSTLEFSSFLSSYPTFAKQKKLLDEMFLLKNEELNLKGLDVPKIVNFHFKDFSFSYDRKIFNFTSENLESFKITGSNGSGKSTLMKCIAGIQKGDGEWKINNISFEYYSLNSIRESFIYIESNQKLFGDRVIDFITSGSYECRDIFIKNFEKFNLAAILDSAKIKLTDHIIGGGINFSAGQKQIINWLRIFSSNYKLLLFDEAFENVDINNFMLIKEAMQSIETMTIEVSHSKKYIFKSKEVKID